jgi:response regulator RpfG family c-di-GMP phosphodiesterase
MGTFGGERVLVVDDEEPIRAMLIHFLEQRGYQTAGAADGSEALQMLARNPFDLVLSDVRMPGMSGLALLDEIVQRYPATGVVMLTGCEDVSMAVGAMKAGALDYVLKPFRLNDVEACVRRALDRHHQTLEKAAYLRQLESAVRLQTVELRRTLAHLEEASEITLEALVAALDAREHETKAHSKRVGEYTVHLARQLGVSREGLETIRRGAMLHDIGKIGIPDRILLKPEGLTEGEWREMRRHPQIGYWILSGVESLRSAAEIVLCHHERYDGTGYPRGLQGEAIVLGARIFSVTDSLDAMTSDRPYHRHVSWEEARREIAANAGSQFDPEIVREFLDVPVATWPEIRDRTLAEPAREVPEIAPLVLT